MSFQFEEQQAKLSLEQKTFFIIFIMHVFWQLDGEKIERKMVIFPRSVLDKNGHFLTSHHFFQRNS